MRAGHHRPGFIDKATFDANRERDCSNTRLRAHELGRAVREGATLLEGIVVCGRCGRAPSPGFIGLLR